MVFLKNSFAVYQKRHIFLHHMILDFVVWYIPQHRNLRFLTDFLHDAFLLSRIQSLLLSNTKHLNSLFLLFSSFWPDFRNLQENLPVFLTLIPHLTDIFVQILVSFFVALFEIHYHIGFCVCRIQYLQFWK